MAIKKFNLSIEDIENIILWSRIWAEYVEDDEVLEMWKKKTNFVKDWGDRQFDLNKIFAKRGQHE